MNAKSTSDNLNLIIKDFTAPKQTKLFVSLQKAQVSGQLTCTVPMQGSKWQLYFYQGAIVYATGGIHPVRRWQRNLISNLPQIPFQLADLQEELTKQEADLADNIWEYEQISRWVEQQTITPQQGTNAIMYALQEILFDITQARQIICCLDQHKVLFPKLATIAPEEVIKQTQQLWQSWEDARVADRYPNLAPIIFQSQELQQKTSISAYQSLCKLLNGNRTIRDLSVQLKTPALQVIYSLLPYIQSGIFGLVDVPDLLESFSQAHPNNNNPNRPLIACVDDSLMVSHMMEQILNLAGYRFLAINDPLEAMSILVERKPDLIFLDIVMPKISGYDLCAQLRKHAEFNDTPIVFLTSNNGLIDRLRAKLVGSSGFLKKTVDADDILQKIAEYLPS